MKAIWTHQHSDEVSGKTGFDDGSVAYWGEGDEIVLRLPNGTTRMLDLTSTDAHALVLVEADLGDEVREMSEDEEAEFEQVYFGA